MRFASALLLAVALTGCGNGKLTFETRIADLRKAGNHFASGKEPEDSVQVTVPGKMLDSATVLEHVTRSQSDWTAPEHAVASVISANLSFESR